MNNLDNMHNLKTQTIRNKKHIKKMNIKRYSFDFKPQEREIIDKLMTKTGKSKKDTVLSACKYCLDHNITFND